MPPDLDPILVTWGHNIRTARQTKNLTQTGLARLCNVRPETVWRWEHGYKEPNRQRQLLIAQAVEVHPAVLFPHDGQGTAA